MKNRINSLTAIMVITGAVLTGCQSLGTKEKRDLRVLQDVKYNVTETLGGLNKTQQDSIIIYQKFKTESEKRILNHGKNIAEFKELLTKGNKKNKAKYEIELARYVQNNIDMKNKLYNNK